MAKDNCKDNEHLIDFGATIESMVRLNLKNKTATVGIEVPCFDCDLIVNLSGGLTVEVKGEDYR